MPTTSTPIPHTAEVCASARTSTRVGAGLLVLFTAVQLAPWGWVRSAGLMAALLGIAATGYVWARHGKHNTFDQKNLWLLWIWAATEAALWCFFASFPTGRSYFYFVVTVGWYTLVLYRLHKVSLGSGTVYQVFMVLAVKALAWDFVLGIAATPRHGLSSTPVLASLGWLHPLGQDPVLLLAGCELYLLMAREMVKRYTSKQ